MASSATWLALMSLQALLILILQVALGVLFGVLELEADSAHSAVDVLTYMFALVIEIVKARSPNGTYQKADVKVMDCIGSAISVFTLFVVTSIAVLGAYEQFAFPPLEQTDDQRGLAMLIFAIVTFTANVGMIALCRRWGLGLHQRSGSRQFASPMNASVDVDGQKQPPIPDWCYRVLHEEAVQHLEEAVQHPDTGGQDDDASCGSSGPNGTNESCKSENLDPGKGWYHNLHPGCNCNLVEDQAGMTGKVSINLNLWSALLHLSSDCLRALTVFCSALLIECHFAKAWRVDAIGSLFIAAFNVLGAVTLFVRAYNSR